MALIDDPIPNNDTYVVLTPSVDNAGYTDALRRDFFEKTSIHCPTQAVTVQVSLKPEPDPTSDTDWYTVGAADNFIWIDYPVRWLRAKGVGEKDEVYVLSVTFGME